MHDDFYQIYLDELEALPICSPEEEQELLKRVSQQDEAAKARLTEGMLGFVAEIAKTYEGQGLPMGDLVQEGNMALVLTIGAWKDGDFRQVLKT